MTALSDSRSSSLVVASLRDEYPPLHRLPLRDECNLRQPLISPSANDEQDEQLPEILPPSLEQMGLQEYAWEEAYIQESPLDSPCPYAYPPSGLPAYVTSVPYRRDLLMHAYPDGQRLPCSWY